MTLEFGPGSERHRKLADADRLMNRDTADPPGDEQEKQLKGESSLLVDPLQALEP